MPKQPVITVPSAPRLRGRADKFGAQCKRVGQAWIELGFTYERLAEIGHEVTDESREKETP